MGRELKRVPLDFAWPLDKPWDGYCNPLYVAKQCGHCGGTGQTLFSRRLSDRWYGRVGDAESKGTGRPEIQRPFCPEDNGSTPFAPSNTPILAFAEHNVNHSPKYYGTGELAIYREAKRLCLLFNRQWSHHLNSDDVAALIAAGRLQDLTAIFVAGKGWQAKEPAHIPTPREVNEWSIRGMGHDAINRWICIKAACERAGEKSACPHCDGAGDIWPSKEAEQAYEDWRKHEPPSGEGYQIWETVSEGSPISPVFSTSRDLAAHMATTRWGADKGTPFETWLRFIEGPGWAPSMIVDNNGVHNGVDAVVARATPAEH